jgi:hypothetical protein
LDGGALAAGFFEAALFFGASLAGATFFLDLLAAAGALAFVFLSSTFFVTTFLLSFFAPFGGVLEGFSVLLIDLEPDLVPLVLAASFSFYLSNFS